MRAVAAMGALAALAVALSGCAVVSVATTAVDITATAVSTTADIGSSVVRGTVHTVTGSGSDDATKDKQPD